MVIMALAELSHYRDACGTAPAGKRTTEGCVISTEEQLLEIHCLGKECALFMVNVKSAWPED